MTIDLFLVWYIWMLHSSIRGLFCVDTTPLIERRGRKLSELLTAFSYLFWTI